MNNPEEVVRAACQVIWSDGDVARVAEFYADDFTADYPLTDWGSGVPGVTALAAQVRRDLPGYSEEIEELIAAGDEVVVRLNITGRHPQSGANVSFRDVSILTVKNGKITRQRGLTDYFSLFKQLGVLDMRTPG